MPTPISFTFDQSATLQSYLDLEWLETNGVGGWASSTLCGTHTRRYHGMLVAALPPPLGRMVMLSRLDETLLFESGRYPLSTRLYTEGYLYPAAFHALVAFEKELFPTFHYRIATKRGAIEIKKRVAAIHGQNTTVVIYHLETSPGEISLELEPFVAGRDYHSLAHANSAICGEARQSGDQLLLTPYSGLPSISLLVPGATFTSGAEWYYRFHYAKEEERGLDCEEDLFRYGTLQKQLKEGESFAIAITTEESFTKDPMQLYSDERLRRERLIAGAAEGDPLVKSLTLAADQFIIQNPKKTVIAGYHWFTDWGRDTMIALPGLTLATGRQGEAKEILQSFAKYIDRGMIPNRFADGAGHAEYNTADATLWYFIALYHYVEETRDIPFLAELYDRLTQIVEWHEGGTRYGIRMADDGLLEIGPDGGALTWMDARVDGVAITPRTGKVVEINALWYNLLSIMGHYSRLLNMNGTANSYKSQAEKTLSAFQKNFWNPDAQYFFDAVAADGPDSSLRPNQLLALSLPFPLAEEQQAEAVLDIVERKLLTPMGLRSLSPDDPNYIGLYRGDGRHRDSAYHQGTVWSWLIGPYITALVRYRKESGREQGKQLLAKLAEQLHEAGVGTISEIYDGDSPHSPRGCIAQAWSVAEMLRAHAELYPNAVRVD